MRRLFDLICSWRWEACRHLERVERQLFTAVFQWAEDSDAHDASLVVGAASVEPNYVQYLYQTHTILSLVSIGMGIALVPSTAQHLPSERIIFKQIELGGACAELHLAWRKDDPDPVTKNFRSFILGLSGV